MFMRSIVVSAIACCAWIPATRADESAAAFIDPNNAGPDIAIQGEYSGEVKTKEGAKKIGVQVVALGQGKFHAVAYVGGLPGDGWDRGELKHVDGESQDGAVVFKGEKGSGRIKDGVLTAMNSGGETIAEFRRVVRESPTLGARPPEGAVVLFDGTSADAFEGGQLSDDGWLIQGVTSKQKFQDFTLHLEFRTPFMPDARGQGRGNSGCYLQGRYEVQVLDSFGLEGKNNECGGIYSIRDPNLNMCYPPLSWQTYDIDYTAARFDQGQKVKHAVMTVRHNGVLVHENVELDHATTAAPVAEGADPGPVFLQDHGNPVRYRNIWVLEKKAS